MTLLARLRALVRGPDGRPAEAIEAEIAEELAFHLDARTEENIAAGMDPAAARADAQARFGDFARVRDACRWVRPGERIMLQRIHFVLTLVLVCAIGYTAVEAAALRGELRSLRAPGVPFLEMAFLGRGGEVQIGIGDTLRVTDFAHPEEIDVAAEEVQLDGQVLLPIVGWVELSGLTRPDAERRLNELYAQYFAQAPDVKVKVTKSWSRRADVRVAGF